MGMTCANSGFVGYPILLLTLAPVAGVVLALQNHEPVIRDYRDVLAMIREVGSPAFKACIKDLASLTCSASIRFRP